MSLALVSCFLCAWKVVCYSCSPSQQTWIFFSFHMIWLKTAGNLNVSFGVLHRLRQNCKHESRLAQAVPAPESTDQNLVLHDAASQERSRLSGTRGRGGIRRRPEPGPACARCAVRGLCWLRPPGAFWPSLSKEPNNAGCSWQGRAWLTQIRVLGEVLWGNRTGSISTMTTSAPVSAVQKQNSQKCYHTKSYVAFVL